MHMILTWRTARQASQLLVTAHPLARVRDVFGGRDRLFVGGREVTADATLAAAGVRDGAVVSTVPTRPPVPVAPPGSLALLVASGSAAGASCVIPLGGMTVGRSAPFALHDDEVSRCHLQLRPDGESAAVTDLESSNGTVVAGHQLTMERTVAPGELIWVGRTALTVAKAPERDAALSGTPDGPQRYSRSPRLVEQPRGRPIVMPEPPPEPPKPPFPALALIVPVLAGAVVVALTRHLEYLAFVALSPAMLIGNVITERRRGATSHRQRVADFEGRREQAKAELAAARQAELGYRRHLHPDPASLLLIASAPSRRLWERHPDDDDFLALRIGTGRTGWAPGPPGPPGSAAADELLDAPVVLVLPECGAAGLTGPRARTRALTRSMLLSVAVLHSPRDVTVTVLTGPDTAADWDWLRWLPHARQPDSHQGLVRIGNDDASIRQRLAELSTALDRRLPETAAGRGEVRPGGTDLVVLDGSYWLRLRFELDTLLRDGPAAGLCFLCLDDTAAQLPTESRRAVVQLTDDHGAKLARVRWSAGEHDGVVADTVSAAVCEVGARALAPLVDAGGPAAGTGLPQATRFLDRAGLDPPGPAQIRSRWAAGGRSTQALLGARADGPFLLDLAQGPHLLVAGTTGSGKSELLQTLIAALAVANRPDAMNFVLIDYKGGAAFRPFRSLPHTVGMLTDLDEFLVERALTSLRAELQRRKAVLDQADKSNIQRYWDGLAGRPGSDPLPRLVIVVDEFAVMADKLPDQLSSLIDVGRQGRSLGIHLVLATQRPAGVVTNDLKSNMNLRIALRVAAAEDSRDVIETVDAARIPAEGSAGRAYAWLGGGRPVAFQTARVGGLRPGARSAQPRVQVSPLGWSDLGRCLPQAEPGKPGLEEPTDLSVLVEAISAAAHHEDASDQRSPWPPPLPSVLTRPDLMARQELAAATASHPLRLCYGLVDQPQAQRQVPAVFDVARGGHLLVAGAPQSGRSTMLRTLAGSLAAQLGPDEAQLYVFDGGGALAALADLPHCGAVVTAAEPDRVDRLLGRLTGELSARIRLLSAGGHSDLAEYRAVQPAGRRPPFLLVFVDRYDAFCAALEQVDGGRLVGQLHRLFRDGLAAGIRVVATGDRTLLTGRIGTLAEDKLLLRLADRADFALAGLHARAIPADLPNGRGFRLPGTDLLQVAVLSPQATGAAENQALRELAGRPGAGPFRPFRVDPLPLAITLRLALQLPRPEDGVLVGVGGDELSQVRVGGPTVLTIGAPGSGRSTALGAQASSLAAGTPLVLITPRQSAVPGALDPAAIVVQLTGSGPDAAAALTGALAAAGPAAIVVDDAELLSDTPLGNELVAQLPGLRDSGHRLLAAASAESAGGLRGLVPALAKGKCGLVLEPGSTADGMPLGSRLPASVLAGGLPLRAALVCHGRITAVQVPAWSDPAADQVAALTSTASE